MVEDTGEDALKRAKASRNAHRGTATKYCNEIDPLLLIPANDRTVMQTRQLIALQSKLKRKVEDICAKNKTIEDLTPDEDLEAELNAAEENIDRIQEFIDRVDWDQDEIAKKEKRKAASDADAATASVAASAATAAATAAASASGTTTSPPQQVKLPALDLVSFTGSYSEWTSFIDLFDATVHANTHLTKSQKLQYLKYAVKGDAAKLISNLLITEANYEIARQALITRYSNKRAIVWSHIDAICSMPAMKTDSSVSLRKVIETVDENRQALLGQGLEVDKWDAILIYNVAKKLDLETWKQWELQSKGTDLQKYDDLKEFLENRCRALENPEISRCAPQAQDKRQNNQSTAKRTGMQGSAYHSTVEACPCCNGEHRIYKCDKFTKMSAPEKRTFVQGKRLCYNCLRAGHMKQDCRSTSTCTVCKKPHNTLLHRDPAPEAKLNHAHTDAKDVILATASVNVYTDRGNVTCRALLDSGSQLSFISEACAQRLSLPRKKARATINGIGNEKVATTNHMVDLELIPTSTQARIHVWALVLPKLTSVLPNCEVDVRDKLPDVQLADTKFNIPAGIDLLLGADVYDQVVGQQKRQIGKRLFLRDTAFGWVVSGALDKSSTMVGDTHALHGQVDFQLQSFWEVEDVKCAPQLTAEELACQTHYDTTTTRDGDGRYVVAMPFKPMSQKLGNSSDQAMSRFLSLERRLQRFPVLKKEYTKVIQEFCDLGHMEEIPSDEVDKPDSEHFYLSHHCVVKESSTTSKYRVVFNGSAFSTSGLSLNDVLMIGPQLQDNIFDILVRLRFHAYVFSADVAKMYRQIGLQAPDKDFHRILWRDEPTQEIKHLRMTRVTYGIRSSSYHSIRSLQETAALTDDAPTSAAIRRDFYVDDLMSGAESVEMAVSLRDNLLITLKKGAFELRKFTASDPRILDGLPDNLIECKDSHAITDDKYSVKTLGVSWYPGTDVFSFTITVDEATTTTKRILLSEISKVYDPLGFLAPITITLKILIQSTWVAGCDWDEPLPPNIIEEWQNIRSQLQAVTSIKVPRAMCSKSKTDIQLHVFTDASEKAYAAAIYTRITDSQGCVHTRLLCAKTKVSPVKSLSLPRLELCAAHLGTKILAAVQSALVKTDYVIADVYAWTDSTIVLSWIADLPRKWTCFVANRVSEIQGVLPPSAWKHVPSKDNPADCASRGLLPAKIEDFHLWWEGPVWLKDSPLLWPRSEAKIANVSEERKHPVTLHTKTHTPIIDVSRFSSLSRLLHTVAYVKRFIALLRRKNTCAKTSTGSVNDRIAQIPTLNCDEIEEARLHILRQHQAEFYGKELAMCMGGRQLPSTDALSSLSIFFDHDINLLRVGGRLAQSEHPESVKYPILISPKSRLADLIIWRSHRTTWHGGPQMTLADTRQQYWIVSGRRKVRQLVRLCKRCSRFALPKPSQLMGDLPEERITQARPFTNTGIDFAGPFTTKDGPRKTSKSYLAIFVCFATKAVHLEAVSALTKDACLAAIRRFIARRGKPNCIYSDNGTNFVGARNELAAMEGLLSDTDNQDSLKHYAATQGMNWVMIPPRAPHFGGLWEAAVKSAKKHLRKVIGLTVLNFEELTTVFTQVEAVLNSRPLIPLSSDPNDLEALTAGHFLIGAPLTALPETFKENTTSPLQRWKLVQSLCQQFWKRWHKEYLSTLQQRFKWKTEQPVIAPGDLVFVAEDNLPPLQWALGRVVETYLGNDKLARVAKVLTNGRTLMRPIVKLRRLPMEN